MSNKETHIKSIIGTLILCLSLLVYTIPSAASMDHSQNESHILVQDTASSTAHDMSKHCKEMQQQSVDECCHNVNCDCVCISGASAFSLVTMLQQQIRHAESINAIAISSLRSQTDEQPTPPPIN